jgi:hypothetical protein
MGCFNYQLNQSSMPLDDRPAGRWLVLIGAVTLLIAIFP